MNKDELAELLKRHRFLCILIGSGVGLVLLGTTALTVFSSTDDKKDELDVLLEKTKNDRDNYPYFESSLLTNFKTFDFPVKLDKNAPIYFDGYYLQGLDLTLNLSVIAPEEDIDESMVTNFLAKTKRLICLGGEYNNMDIKVHVKTTYKLYVPSRVKEVTYPLSEVCKLSTW